MKYIDADLLRDKIKENKYVIEPLFLKGDDSYYEGEDDGYNRILSIIDSLQQEQPEVNLETFDKSVTKMWGRCAAEPNDTIACLHIDSFIEVARHFFNLGLNTRKV